jgi:hypothetical protein
MNRANSDPDDVDFDEDPNAADDIIRGGDGREWKSDEPVWS